MAFLGKTGLILSAGLLLAGGILFGIGAANGGIEQVEAMAENGELSIGRNHFFHHNRDRYTTQIAEVAITGTEYDYAFSSAGDTAFEISEAEAMPILYAEEMEEEWQEYNGGFQKIAEKDEIKRLEIEWNSTASGDLYLWRISGDYFQILQDNVSYKVDGDTLKILSGGHGLGIPKSWVGEEILISVGTGCIYTEELYAEEIAIKVGTGYIQSTFVKADQFRAEISSGMLELYGLQADDAEISIGIGAAQIMDGTLTGDLDVDCGMGALIMYLSGKESDHNYEVDSTGSLNIGNYSQYGFRNNFEINNHASSEFKIKCGAGSVDIYFEEMN